MSCGRYESHKFYGPRIFSKSLLFKKGYFAGFVEDTR